jgi:hypothetical protein
MRITALLSAVTAAVALTLVGCGGGCAHGGHHHAINSTYEQPPDYNTTCTCQESGEIDCGGETVSD